MTGPACPKAGESVSKTDCGGFDSQPGSPSLKALTRTLRERTQYLKMLTTSIDQFLTWLDAAMLKPSSGTRGRRIARARNALDMANQHAKLFGLPRKARATSGKKGTT